MIMEEQPPPEAQPPQMPPKEPKQPPPAPFVPKTRALPEVPENNDALLGEGSKGGKEQREHEDYNDFLKKKQALMSIPGLDLA